MEPDISKSMIRSVNSYYTADYSKSTHTDVVIFDGVRYCFARTNLNPNDIDEEVVLKDKNLKPIPLEDIYPPFSSHLTRAPENCIQKSVYIRGPEVEDYVPHEGQEIANRLLHEAEIYEILRQHPHPALGGSLGCVVGHVDRITGIALVDYDDDVYHRAKETQSFGMEQRNRCIQSLKEAVKHLHSLGLAHNSISTMGVMFEGDQTILTDYRTCQPIGTTLKRSLEPPNRHNGDYTVTYETSSAERDIASIDYIDAWLKRTYDEAKSKNDKEQE